MATLGKRAARKPGGEPERLRGIARLADGRVGFRRVTLTSEKKTLATIDEGEFELALEGGGTVNVETLVEGLVLVRGSRAEKLTGVWSELRERPEMSGVKRNLVAPFAEVELSTVAVQSGEPVEILGTVFEWAFDDDATTFREGATKRPARVLASMMAFGEPAEDLMRAMTIAIADAKRPPEPEPPAAIPREDEPEDAWGPQKAASWVPLAAALLGVIWFLVAHGLATSRQVAWREELRAIEWAALALSFRPWPDVPLFRSRAKQIRRWSAPVFGARLLLGSAPFVFVVGSWSASEVPTVTQSLVEAIGFLLGWTALELFSYARDHAVLATLVSARRLASFTETEPIGVCEGRVTDRSTVKVAGRKAVMGIVTHFAKGYGDDADTAEGSKFSACRRFLVEVNGRTVEVDPDECLWATAVRRDPNNPDGDYDVAEWVPVDAKVALYGQFVVLKPGRGSAGARLLAIGKRPAVVFATSAGGDPLRRASRVLWHRRLTLLGLAILLGAVATLTLWHPV